MNEVTRRLLSVLLRFLEGFNANNEEAGKNGSNGESGKRETAPKHNILICATNRKHDLDSVLLSAFPLFPGIAEPIRRAAPFPSPGCGGAKADFCVLCEAA